MIADRREAFLRDKETNINQANKRKNYALLDLLLDAQLNGSEALTDEDIREG